MRVAREAEGGVKYLWRVGEIFVEGLISINRGAGGVSRELITLNFESTIHSAPATATAATATAGTATATAGTATATAATAFATLEIACAFCRKGCTKKWQLDPVTGPGGPRALQRAAVRNQCIEFPDERGTSRSTLASESECFA